VRPGRLKSLLRIALSAALVALAVRVAYLFFVYISGSGTVQRHHVESTAVFFAAVALALKYVGSDATPASGSGVRPPPPPSWLWLLFCAAGIALYWPALFTGFLSDDFGLAARAAAWDVSPVSAVLFRPIPMLVWAALLQVGAGPVALHLLNVLLHGTNAFLSTVVISEWTTRRWSVTGGFLVLTAPLATEAVVWCSGVFDVSATTMALWAAVCAGHYSNGTPSRANRVAFLAACLGAVLCKETAAVVPVLAVVLAWARGSFPPVLRRDLLVVVVLIGAFGLIRLTNSSETIEPLTKYVLQRALFSGFGSLAVPYHVQLIQRAAWIAIAAVLLTIGLLTQFAIAAGPRRDLRIAASAVLWILVAIALVVPVLVIAPDLQASRYLYLATFGWTSLLVVCAGRVRGATPEAVGLPGLVALVALNSAAATVHLKPWIEAARTRDAIEQAARTNSRMQSCATIALIGLPDSVAGAYLFRNSVAEAFARDLAMTIVTDRPACSFQWQDGVFVER
jgi:hypothetical protein